METHSPLVRVGLENHCEITVSMGWITEEVHATILDTQSIIQKITEFTSSRMPNQYMSGLQHPGLGWMARLCYFAVTDAGNSAGKT